MVNTLICIQLVKEDANGENVTVEANPAATSERHPHLQRVRSLAHRDHDTITPQAQIRRDSIDDTPTRQVFKKDSKTGKLRPLTKSEIRAEEADRAAKKEAHYCSAGNESVWEDDEVVMIVRKDGEDLEIRRKEGTSEGRPGRERHLHSAVTR